MIRHSFVFLILFFVIDCSISAQSNKARFEMGEYYYEENSFQIPEIVGLDETGFYTYTTNRNLPNQVTIEHFDKQLKRTLFSRLRFMPDGKDRKFEYIYFANNTIFLFSSYPVAHQNKRYLDVQTVNKQTLKVNNDLKQVSEVDNKFSNHGRFEFTTSNDNTKLLIYCNYPNEKDKEEKFGFTVFDEQITKVWAKDLVLPYKEKVFGVESFSVDNSGRLLLLGVLFDDKAREIRDKEADGNINFSMLNFKKMMQEVKRQGLFYQYIILSYNGKDELPNQYELSYEDKFLKDLQIGVDKENDLICAGYYSEKGVKTIEGVFFMKIDDESKEVKQKSMKEFSMDFMTSGMTEKQLEEVGKRIKMGKEVELYQFDLGNLIFRPNGDITLIGEQYFYDFSLSTMNPLYSYRERLDYNDLLITNINSEGLIQWSNKIAKKQKSNHKDFFSSYAVAIVNDYLYIVYNDNALNHNPKSLYKPYTFNCNLTTESVLVVAEINKEGTVSKWPLISSRETKVTQKPKLSLQIEKNVLMIFGQYNAKHRFSKIIFE